MDYTELNVSIKPFSQQTAEIITALLAQIGFDSFVTEDNGLLAYIPTKAYSESETHSLLSDIPELGAKVSFNAKSIEDQNWNKKWESYYEPIIIEKFCRVRAPFHESESGYDLEIIIEPKMAFGTGHHQTTWLMTRELFGINLCNKTVLDMGCGTGILAIAAEKLGAKRVTAIDIDEWAFSNASENIIKNNCTKTLVELGDASVLGKEKFDIILANINLNILVADIKTYVNCLNTNGLLVMSGIILSDINLLVQTAKEIGLSIVNQETRDNWALLSTQKK